MTNNHSFHSRAYVDSVLIPWTKQRGIEPLDIKDAEGVYVTLKDGHRLIDMKSQAFNANLGHKHAGMIDALVKAASTVTVKNSETMCNERLGLALELKRIAPKNDQISLTKTFFTLGGAEANENAIKMARLFTKRHKVITRYRSYHGATLATINASGDYRRIAVDDSSPGIIRIPDPYPRGSGQTIDTVRLLEEIIEIEGPETIAAILLEGITGANGVFVPPPDYWSRIRALCDKFGIVLIADEIFSGFFRTGTWFGVNHFNVVPDMITMSKGLTAGYAALGAVQIRKEIAEFFDDNVLWCGLTQYGQSLACATARAAIAIYEDERIGDNVNARGRELQEMLAALKRDHEIVAETRSIGLLAAIDLRKSEKDSTPLVPYRATGDALKPAHQLGALLKEAGVLALIRFGTLLLAPPLTVSQSELKHAFASINEAFVSFSRRS